MVLWLLIAAAPTSYTSLSGPCLIVKICLDFMWWQGLCWYWVKTFRIFAYWITEYVGDVACCASIILACLLNINVFSLLCCKTDYLFCYISINVILLLKACSILHRFFAKNVFFLARLILWRGCRSCVTQPATPLLSSCSLHWRSASEPRCRHDSPAPAMSSAQPSTHHALCFYFQTNTRDAQDTQSQCNFSVSVCKSQCRIVLTVSLSLHSGLDEMICDITNSDRYSANTSVRETLKALTSHITWDTFLFIYNQAPTFKDVPPSH